MKNIQGKIVLSIFLLSIPFSIVILGTFFLDGNNLKMGGGLKAVASVLFSEGDSNQTPVVSVEENQTITTEPIPAVVTSEESVTTNTDQAPTSITPGESTVTTVEQKPVVTTPEQTPATTTDQVSAVTTSEESTATTSIITVVSTPEQTSTSTSATTTEQITVVPTPEQITATTTEELSTVNIQEPKNIISKPLNSELIIRSVSSPILKGIFHSGIIPIIVTFNKTVVVSGTPKLILSTGNPSNTQVELRFNSGNRLYFLYKIVPGNFANLLDYVSASALVLNGGHIRDVSGNEANLTLPAPGYFNSLSGKSQIIIEAFP